MVKQENNREYYSFMLINSNYISKNIQYELNVIFNN